MSTAALSTRAVLGLLLLSFLATLFAYFLGIFVQLLNLPFGLLVSSLCVFGAAGLFFPLLVNLSPLRFTGLSQASPVTVGLAVLIGVVNLPLANFLMGIFTELMPADWVESAKAVTRLFLQADRPTRIVLTLGAAVAAPIGEELFFRGWLQTALLRRLRPWLSIAIASVLFSLVHGDLVGFVARVELGVLFGVARLATGSLWPAIALHAAHNFISLMAVFFVADAALELDRPFDIAQTFPIALGSALLVFLLVRLLRRLGASEPRKELRAHDEQRPPFVPNPRPALLFLTLTLLVTLTATTTVYFLRDRLPGASLRLQPGTGEHSDSEPELGHE